MTEEFAGYEQGLDIQKNTTQQQATSLSIGRYAQEIQGMVFMAKSFPREPFKSIEKIKIACQRAALAKDATYKYPRGGENVSGPSIRLAEVLAQNWGNMAHGIIELEQRAGESTAMAYAWDLESNTRSEIIFTVKHERKAKGKINKLTDPRDIYELVANYGARRKRACILAVIPKDVSDEAVAECRKTMAGDNAEPLIDRVRKMFEAFKKYGVTQEMVEAKQGYKADKFIEEDLVELREIYNALKDGIGKRDDYFDLTAAPTSTNGSGGSLEKDFAKSQAAPAKEKAKGAEDDGEFS